MNNSCRIKGQIFDFWINWTIKSCFFKYKNFLSLYRFGTVMFIVASDNREWCSKVFSEVDDVFIVDEAEAHEDMALLSSYDHQVYSHGTFGLWILLLSQSITVVYPAPDTNYDRYLIHLSFDNMNLTNFVAVQY